MKRGISENTKVTLTVRQLRKLIRESAVLIKEREEIEIVTPTGEHIGMKDDEGYFSRGYPGRYDVGGTYVDDDGYYAKKVGMYSPEYGYKNAKEKTNEPKPIDPKDVFTEDKFFAGKSPKSESQAVYYLYQMVCVAQGKKYPPDSPGSTPVVAKTLFEINDMLGIKEPEIDPDSEEMDTRSWHYDLRKGEERLANATNEKEKKDAEEEIKYANDSHKFCVDALGKAEKSWREGTFGITSPATTWRGACSDALGAVFTGLDGDAHYASAYVSTDSRALDNFLKEIKKLILAYYRTDKGARNTTPIKEFLQKSIDKAKKISLRAPDRAFIMGISY